ncbi:MAG: SPOR domain-containing protein, partial [Plesiomonas sp.]
KALPAQQGVAQMTIDVPPLTRPESLTLMKAALVRAQRPAQDAEALLGTGTALRPGMVLAAAEKPLLPEPEPDLLPKPRAQRAKESRSRVGLISLAVLVLLALGAGTWVWLSEHSAPAKSTFTPGDRAASVSSQPLGGQSDEHSAEKVLPKVEGAPLDPVPDVKGRLNSGDVAPIQQNEQVRLTEQSPVAQITAPTEPGETTQAQILPQTGKRVVLPGNVVDALVAAEQQVQQAATPTSTSPATDANATDAAKPADASANDSAATSTAISPEHAAAAKRAESVKADNAKAQATKESAAKPTATKRRHNSRLSGDTELEKASPKHYTVQLSGSHSLKDAWHFVEKSGLASTLRVYETRRNGRAWYVVIMGNYPNVAQAKQAINTLPAALKADQPWVKSYRQVQTELKRAQ